jgi:hypothetical protein
MLAKKVIEDNNMFVLIISVTFIWNASHFKKNSARYFDKYTNVFMWSTSHACQIVTKLEVSR